MRLTEPIFSPNCSNAEKPCLQTIMARFENIWVSYRFMRLFLGHLTSNICM